MRNSTIVLLSLFAMAHASTLRHGEQTSMFSADTADPTVPAPVPGATKFSVLEDETSAEDETGEDDDFGFGEAATGPTGGAATGPTGGAATGPTVGAATGSAGAAAAEMEEDEAKNVQSKADFGSGDFGSGDVGSGDDIVQEPPTDHELAVNDKNLHDTKLQELRKIAYDTNEKLSAANLILEGARKTFVSADLDYQEKLTAVKTVAPKHFEAEDAKAKAILKLHSSAMNLAHIKAKEEFDNHGLKIEGIQDRLRGVRDELVAANAERVGKFQSLVDTADENRRIAQENYDSYEPGTALKKAMDKTGGDRSLGAAGAAIGQVAGSSAPKAVHKPVNV